MRKLVCFIQILSCLSLIQLMRANDLEFVEAAERGRSDIVKRLLEADPKLVNAVEGGIDPTAQHWALIYGIKDANEVIFSSGNRNTRSKKVEQSDSSNLKGPYLGQKPPGMTPKLFAPEFVSTEEFREFSGTFTPDGKEYYFFRFAEGAGMMVTQLLDEGWTSPTPAIFNTKYIDNEPHITPDGKYLFFNSNRPVPGNEAERTPTQIWYMERIGGTWGDPRHLCEGMFATSSRNGNIYLNEGKTKLVNGKFAPFQKIAGALNDPPDGWQRGRHSSIAPDESFLIFDTQREGSEWNSDENLFICFRTADGSWSKAYDLGSALNLPGGKMLATLSPDGCYLFFCHKGDIYWIDAKIIETLKPEELK